MALNTSETALLSDMESKRDDAPEQTALYDPAKSVAKEARKRVGEPVPSDLGLPPEGIQVADASGKWPYSDGARTYPYKALREQQEPAIVRAQEKREAWDQEKQQIKLAQDLARAEKPNSVIDFFGSFTSEIDFNYVDFDKNTGTYSNVVVAIDPNENISGYENMDLRTFSIPDGLNKEEILDYKEKIDRNVLKSGDLTYRPQSTLDPLLSVTLAETTVLPQGIRPAANLLPITFGWRASKAVAPAAGRAGAGVAPFTSPAVGAVVTGSIIVGTFGLISAGSYAVGNKLMEKWVGSDFDRHGWAQFLFHMQESEIQLRGLDPMKVRTLTVEQYTQLLDPTFAPYWTKFANTLTENVVGTLTFMSPAGFSMLSRAKIGKEGELLGLSKWSISGSRNAYVTDIHKTAMKNIKEINKERIAAGLQPHTITKQRVMNEIRLVVKDNKEKMKSTVRLGVSRLIYGFRDTQVAEQLLNKPLFWSEIMLAEGGAASLVSLGSYYQLMHTSPRTEDLDKLPFLITGATIGSYGSVGITSWASPVRWATGISGALARLITDNNQEVKAAFDFIQGKSSLPKGLDKEQVKALKKLKTKIGVMDQRLAGEVTRSLQTGIELANNAVELSKRVAKRTGDDSLILEFDNLISSFTDLEVVKSLESFLLKETLSGRSTSEALSATTEKLLRARAVARDKADNVLRKLVLLGKHSGIMEDTQYLKLRTALEDSMKNVSAEAAVKHSMIMNDLLNYEAYESLSLIIENPMQGQERINQIVDFVKSPEGKDFKFNIGDKVYQGQAAAIKFNLLAIEQIRNIKKMAVEKTLAAKFAKKNGEQDKSFIGKKAPNQDTEINPTLINEASGKLLARTMKLRNDNVKAENIRLYKAAWKNSDKHTINVTDLFTELYDDVVAKANSVTRVDAPENVARLTQGIFDTATREGMRSYIKKVGKGDYTEDIR